MELREHKNSNCKNCHNQEERAKYTENDLCHEALSEIDDLPVRCVGRWAKDKIFYLNQYFGIFSNAMKDKWNLNYIEICSGPGRCVIRETGDEIDGTSLSIIRHPMHKYIKRSVFIDYNKNVVNLLEKRIRTLDINNAEVYKGNYFNTDDIDKATDKLNRHSLTLAFIDPTDCSVPYKTLKFLKNKFNKLDIIYNFSFGTDVRRNIRTAIEEPQSKVREKYSNVLGGDSFFKDPEIIKLGKNSINNDKLLTAFYDFYKKQLQKIGFKFFGQSSIRHYYWLVFSSSNKLGLGFWNKIKRIGPNGQREFNFGEY